MNKYRIAELKLLEDITNAVKNLQAASADSPVGVPPVYGEVVRYYNDDGGAPDSVYGGTTTIDAGGI